MMRRLNPPSILGPLVAVVMIVVGGTVELFLIRFGP